MQQNIPNWVYLMVVHTWVVEDHKTVGREGFHWVEEEVGVGLVDSFEGEHKVVLHQGAALMKVEVEAEVD